MIPTNLDKVFHVYKDFDEREFSRIYNVINDPSLTAREMKPDGDYYIKLSEKLWDTKEEVELANLFVDNPILTMLAIKRYIEDEYTFNSSLRFIRFIWLYSVIKFWSVPFLFLKAVGTFCIHVYFCRL